MRLAATVLLWLVTTAALMVAVPTAWAQKNIVDVDGYAALAQQAAADPALQAAVASGLSEEALTVITKHGYSADPARVRQVASAYTADPSFPTQFAQTNRAVHRWMFSGDQSGADAFALNLAPMLPAAFTVPATLSAPKAWRPGQLRSVAAWNPWVSIGAATSAGICAVLTLAVGGSRAKTLTSLGVSALLAGGSGWAAVEIVRRHINAALNDASGDSRRIAEAMVGHAEASLHHWLDVTLAAGAVLVVLGVLVAMLAGLRKA